MIRPLIVFGNFPNFPNSYVPKFGNGQAPRGRCLFISGKLESLENMLLLLQPLWVTVLSLVQQAKGNKDDRSARKLCRMRLLNASGNKSGLLDGAETPT